MDGINIYAPIENKKLLINAVSGIGTNPPDNLADITNQVLAVENNNLVISSMASGLNELHTRVKSSGDEKAINGLEEVVASLTSDGDANAIVNFVASTSQMSDEEVQKYMGIANELFVEGSSSTMGKWVKQVADYSTADKNLGKTFLEGSEQIMEAEYDEDASAKVEILKEYMAAWEGKSITVRTEEQDYLSQMFTELNDKLKASTAGNDMYDIIFDSFVSQVPE